MFLVLTGLFTMHPLSMCSSIAPARMDLTKTYLDSTWYDLKHYFGLEGSGVEF